MTKKLHVVKEDLEVLETLEYKEVISNSYLSDIKRTLMGIAPFFGDERFLKVGRELHRRILEPHKPTDDKFTVQEDEQIRLMEIAFKAEYWDLLEDSEKELRIEGDLYGAKCKGFIDIRKIYRPKKIGIDIKTTIVGGYGGFVAAAKNYDYFRQGHVYMKLADLDDFLFIAIQKRPPYQVFELRCSSFPNLMKEAKEETKFLVDIYKRFIKK